MKSPEFTSVHNPLMFDDEVSVFEVHDNKIIKNDRIEIVFFDIIFLDKGFMIKSNVMNYMRTPFKKMSHSCAFIVDYIGQLALESHFRISK